MKPRRTSPMVLLFPRLATACGSSRAGPKRGHADGEACALTTTMNANIASQARRPRDDPGNRDASSKSHRIESQEKTVQSQGESVAKWRGGTAVRSFGFPERRTTTVTT
jgi:hypothetical protein